MTTVLAAAALAAVVGAGLWVRDRRLRRWATQTLEAAFEEWEAALVAAGFEQETAARTEPTPKDRQDAFWRAHPTVVTPVAAGFDGVPQAPACPGRAPSNPPAPGVTHPTPPADAGGRTPREQANPTRSNP